MIESELSFLKSRRVTIPLICVALLTIFGEEDICDKVYDSAERVKRAEEQMIGDASHWPHLSTGYLSDLQFLSENGATRDSNGNIQAPLECE